MSKALLKLIQEEKNIEIRKRHEHIMRRNYNIMLILFLGGGSLVGRHFFNLEQGLFLVMLFLSMYGFLESIQTRYQYYTDELIRGKGKVKTPKKSKK